MTNGQFEGLVRMAVYMAYWEVFNAAPKATGNLSENALKLESTPQGWVIWVDPKIAPYMVYTEEPWVNRKGKNPNEGWFERVAEKVAKNLATFLNGKVEAKSD